MEQVRDEVHGLEERESGLTSRVDNLCRVLGVSTTPARLPMSARKKRRVKSEPNSV
jgi:hypothetical protein